MFVSDTARAWAQIDLDALYHNFKIARDTGKKVMCVIKADAYGHGAVRCGTFLEAHGADAFAVACLSEAIELREAGIKIPILILGYTAPEYAGLLSEYDITQTLVSLDHARALNDAAKSAGVNVCAHIKLDTGMSRSGLFAQDAISVRSAAADAELIMSELKSITVTGMYTHFAVADTPDGEEYTAFQLENYLGVLDILAMKGLRPEVCHTSNSACILSHEETRIDMVREGIMLYGMYPDSAVQSGPLMPVMSLRSRVTQVRPLPKGTRISYGGTYVSPHDMLLAVISAGYADGYSRRLSNSAKVFINGEACTQVGRVCMDMFMVDVTDKNVSIGDEAVLFGAGGISTEEAAGIVGTINYELTCLVTPRVKRVYVHKES